MIGIINAMPCEMALIKDSMQQITTEKIGGITFTRGQIAGKEAVVAPSGIGKVFAAMCAEAMILHYAPEKIVMTGVAGSLTAGLPVGGIALADSAVQHDMDTSPIGDPKGLISGINVIDLPTDAALTARFAEIAKECGYPCKIGRIASGDQFVASAERKAEIVRDFGAIACEMEGAAVAQVCYVNGVPFALIRAMSDSADEEGGMSYAEFLPLACERSGKILLRFLETL